MLDNFRIAKFLFSARHFHIEGDNMQNNQRQHARRYYSTPKPCLLRKSEEHPWEPGLIHNLSLGGARLETTSKISKGEAFQIKVSCSEEVTVACIAINVEDVIVGVSFGLLEEKTVNMLEVEISQDTDAYLDSLLD